MLTIPYDQLLSNTDKNLSRDVPMWIPSKIEEVCIVGGGESIEATLPNLRMRRQRGAKIWALNGAYDWLLDNGLQPDVLVMADGRPEMVGMLGRPRKGIKYLIASQCDPSVFGLLWSYDVEMWIAHCPGIDVEKYDDKPIMVIGGGNTVGLKAMNMASLCTKRIHLYGYDSCYGESHHAYPQPLNDGEKVIGIKVNGRVFTCAEWMAKQASDFQTDYRNVTKTGARVKVHGDGLIPWMYQQLKGIS